MTAPQKEKKMDKIKYSDCCGSSPRNDIEEESGICSECGEHCTYEEDLEKDE